MFKFVLIFVIAAVIEAIQMVVIKDSFFEGESDPDAIPYMAHRVDFPSFGYIPGRTTYDEKHGRNVTDYKYEWEYQGKRHTINVTDNPNSQYEHYMSTFPEEISITINRKTGKYYVAKNVKSRGYKYLLTLAVSLLISYFITCFIFKF